MRALWVFLIFLGSTYVSSAQSPTTSPKSQFVDVGQNVKLEVLDWGGSGRTVVLLAGMGNDAHVYDHFAPKLAQRFHVYGITRRGFGASSKPAPTAENYSASRLGDDVLAVMSSLQLQKPVLVGHSIAGEELSSVGTRFPDKIAGLIYLDAAYGYALYDGTNGDWLLDMLDVQSRLAALKAGRVQDEKQFMNDLAIKVSLLDKDLKNVNRDMAALPTLAPPPPPPPPVFNAIQFGEQKFTKIDVPVLAIFAVPHNFDAMFRDNPRGKALMISNDLARTAKQIDAFKTAVPSATIVRLPNADHYVFNSNEVEVLQSIDVFMAKVQ